MLQLCTNICRVASEIYQLGGKFKFLVFSTQQNWDSLCCKIINTGILLFISVRAQHDMCHFSFELLVYPSCTALPHATSCPPFLGLPPWLLQVKPRSYRYWLSRGTNSLLPPPNPSQHPKPHPSTLQPFHTAIHSLYSTLRSLLKINNLCKWASLTLRPQYVHSLLLSLLQHPPSHQNFVFHNSLDYRSEETEREIGLEKFADERERGMRP